MPEPVLGPAEGRTRGPAPPRRRLGSAAGCASTTRSGSIRASATARRGRSITGKVIALIAIAAVTETSRATPKEAAAAVSRSGSTSLGSCDHVASRSQITEMNR